MGRRSGWHAGRWTAQLKRLPQSCRALLLVMLAPAGAWAADKAPDASLLEFLGSLDGEGSGWSEYLESAELGEAAKRRTPPKPAKPPVPAPAPTVPPVLPPARQPESSK